MQMRQKHKGSTMVEVLVGFTILMILMAGLTAIIHVSSEMLFNTKDMLQEQTDYVKEFYKENHGSLSISKHDSVTISLVETDSTGETELSGGTRLELDHGMLEKVSDTDSGMTVYQLDYR